VTNPRSLEREVVTLRNRLQAYESGARMAIDRLRRLAHLLLVQREPMAVQALAELIGFVQQTRKILAG
jgi:hypothetical protein